MSLKTEDESPKITIQSGKVLTAFDVGLPTSDPW
jgi:hypothetical protein